ncbi:MAG: hypothetical protein IT436_09185 [Phycisphaerales bacterium]|nr:hypothetical protein [Phycisphaerales bacterium]
MKTPELISTQEDRRFWLVALDRPGDWPADPWPALPAFSLLVVADHPGWPAEEIRAFVHRSLEHGARSICCWGDQSDEMEEVFDWDQVFREVLDDYGKRVPFAITTSHRGQTLLQAVWFFCHNSEPYEPRGQRWCDWLTVVIGRPELAAEVRELLADPRALYDRLPDD